MSQDCKEILVDKHSLVDDLKAAKLSSKNVLTSLINYAYNTLLTYYFLLNKNLVIIQL